MKIHFFLFFAVALMAHGYAQEQFSVYFDSNRYELTSSEKNRLELWIVENPKVKIIGIHGFCDEDGSRGFNDTLAKNRIDFVYKLIKDRIKTREDFKTRSFGELHQISKIKAENRKVTLFYLKESDLPKENQILGIKETEPIAGLKEVIRFPDKMVFDNPDGTQSEYPLDVAFMQKVSSSKAGEKLRIENLNFKVNTFIVVPESRGKMYELLLVLQKNPKMKIEIHGHLCCMPNDRLDLSTQRAKAVKNFLIANGIDENRLTYKGFGSSQPIYPLPEKDEMQRAANRRVEIQIVSNEP